MRTHWCFHKMPLISCGNSGGCKDGGSSKLDRDWASWIDWNMESLLTKLDLQWATHCGLGRNREPNDDWVGEHINTQSRSVERSDCWRLRANKANISLIDYALTSNNIRSKITGGGHRKKIIISGRSFMKGYVSGERSSRVNPVGVLVQEEEVELEEEKSSWSLVHNIAWDWLERGDWLLLIPDGKEIQSETRRS